MPDNPPGADAAPTPPPPGGGTPDADAGHVTRVPSAKDSTGKVVVMLSSVAKTPPPVKMGPSIAPPKQVPSFSSQPRPPILPAKEATTPAQKRLSMPNTGRPQLNRTMQVKLPPKTGMLPKLISLGTMPITPTGAKPGGPLPTISPQPALQSKATPPPLPVKRPEPPVEAKETPRRLPPLKLKAVPLSEVSPGDSIFPEAGQENKPPGWKHLEPGELLTPKEGPQSSEVVARSQRVLEKEEAKAPLPASVPPTPVPVVLPPPVAKKEPVRPPPLPISKGPVLTPRPIETPKTAPLLNVAPPLNEHAGVAHAEKLRLPPPHHEPRKLDAPKVADEPVKSTLPPLPGLPAPEKAAVAPVPIPPVPPPVPAAFKTEEKVLPTTPPSIATPVVGSPVKSALPPPPQKLVTPPAMPPGVPVVPPVIRSVPADVPPLKTEVPATPPAFKSPVSSEKSPVIATTKPAGETAIPPALSDDLFLLPPPARPIEPTPKFASTSLPARTLKEMPAKAAASGKIPSLGQVTEPPVPVKASVPEKISSTGQVTEPPIPALNPVPLISGGKAPDGAVAVETPVSTRAARSRKRRLVGTIIFYVILLGIVGPLLFFLGIRFSSETRIEGQVIPPTGTLLTNEVWIVSDFRALASGLAEDLAADRAPKLQDIQERQDHVQRVQADIAAREDRVRLLQEQIQGGKDEITSVIKQAHDASQQIWDGPGAALEAEYQSRLTQLQDAIAARAKSLNLNYQPDNTYQSPEVWANAYRLALYQTPAGVDGTKEHQWIEDQLKSWRDFTKSFDDRKEKLRLQAAQIQLSPTTQVTDVNAKIEDLQHRVDSTLAEEDPLKTELQQAQTDLVQAQTAEASLDPKYYQQLYALPESLIFKRLPVQQNGRFTWSHLDRDAPFAEGEKTHSFWIFARAIRPDGRQYWALCHLSMEQNSIQPLFIQPASFESTKAILRPDLSPDEQQQ
jgi:flagellar protein FliO/FliZ